MIKDFIPLSIWASWPSQNLAKVCTGQSKEYILIETLLRRHLRIRKKLDFFNSLIVLLKAVRIAITPPINLLKLG